LSVVAFFRTVAELCVIALLVAGAGAASINVFVAGLIAAAGPRSGEAVARSAAFDAVAKEAVVALPVGGANFATVVLLVADLIRIARRGSEFAALVDALFLSVAEKAVITVDVAVMSVALPAMGAVASPEIIAGMLSQVLLGCGAGQCQGVSRAGIAGWRVANGHLVVAWCFRRDDGLTKRDGGGRRAQGEKRASPQSHWN